MAEEKMMRLGQAARKLNVGISAIVDYLAIKGIVVQNNHNSKITYSQFQMLTEAFKKASMKGDANAKLTLEVPKATIIGNVGDAKPSVDSIDAWDPNKRPTGIMPSKIKEPKYIQVDLVIPENLSEEEIKKIIEESVLQLDNTYRDLGGNGLVVRNLEIQFQDQWKEVLS